MMMVTVRGHSLSGLIRTSEAVVRSVASCSLDYLYTPWLSRACDMGIFFSLDTEYAQQMLKVLPVEYNRVLPEVNLHLIQ